MRMAVVMIVDDNLNNDDDGNHVGSNGMYFFVE